MVTRCDDVIGAVPIVGPPPSGNAPFGRHLTHALALITVGLFGTVSFDGRQRRVEMAIRSALGASPRARRRLVLTRGLRLAAVGVVTGLVAIAMGARALAAVLFGVAPLDPATLATVSGGLALLAVIGMLDSCPTGVHRPLGDALKRRVNLWVPGFGSSASC